MAKLYQIQETFSKLEIIAIYWSCGLWCYELCVLCMFCS